MIKPNIICIVQARETSKRFPGKILKKINKKNSLEHIYDKLIKISKINKIIFSIPNNKNNLNLKKFLIQKKYYYYLGNENNVLKRYFDTAKFFKADYVLRITADCPLIDNKIIERLINNFLDLKYDYGSNTIIRTFPDGYDAEIFSFNVLQYTYYHATSPFDKEHVTSHMKKNTNFKKYIFKFKKDFSFLRLTIDTKEDFSLIKKIFEIEIKKNNVSLNDIIKLYKNKPSLFKKFIFKINNNLYEKNKGINLYKKAKKIIPGGTMLLTKKPEMFLPKYWPSYFLKSKGINIWDLENKKYFDFSYMGVGTNILGYGNEEVDEAVKKVVQDGNSSTFNCPEEVYLASKLLSIHKWAGMVKFARSGGEANSIAIRIARSFTQNQNIAVCGYHGWHDWYLALNLKNKSNLNSFLIKDLSIKGVPNKLKDTIFSFKYNDYLSLKKLVKEKKIGIIKMEVTRNFEPKNNFLKKIRKLCDKNNIILIFDECTSGFRKTYGGIHKFYEVNPDICMFSKSIGNGYAISAVVGKERFMKFANQTFISSTFWTERIGPTAALKTLEIMKRERSWKIIDTKGKKIKKAWKKIFTKYNLDVSIFGIDALPTYIFNDQNHNMLKGFITKEMLKHNILATNAFYLSIKHEDNLLDEYLYYFDGVISQIANYYYDNKKYNLNFKKDHLPNTGLERFN